MSDERLRTALRTQLRDLEAQGLYKRERQLQTAQGSAIRVGDRDVINFCANNYLGLANHPAILAAAEEGLRRFGYGMASVRFICGTQEIHKELERKISEFLGTDDTILYSSCFDANGGLFETILGEEDAVISDELNHASIIDGIRLCKAQRARYKNGDLADLEAKLKDASNARFRMIATDGVFSMDGYYAKLPEICSLAEKHKALVMVDDSHAVGFTGKAGRGTHERANVIEKIDIITGTLGKALGGANGGYTSGRKEIIDLLRQRSRPYLFSNSIPPAIAAASIAAIDLLKSSSALIDRLNDNTKFFRTEMAKAGFNLLPGEHPIVPIMIGDAALAARFAEAMLIKGIYVIAFSYPVVPQGKARIRTQMSAALTRQDLECAVAKFTEVGHEMKLIG